MLMHIVYHYVTLGLVFDTFLHIRVDSNILIKVTYSENAESLAFTASATILIEPSFLSWVN